jgi:hypothetical protein
VVDWGKVEWSAIAAIQTAKLVASGNFLLAGKRPREERIGKDFLISVGAVRSVYRILARRKSRVN